MTFAFSRFAVIQESLRGPFGGSVVQRTFPSTSIREMDEAYSLWSDGFRRTSTILKASTHHL